MELNDKLEKFLRNNYIVPENKDLMKSFVDDIDQAIRLAQDNYCGTNQLDPNCIS